MIDGVKNTILVLLLVFVGFTFLDRFNKGEPILTGSHYKQIDENVVQAETVVVEKLDLSDLDKKLAEIVDKSVATSFSKILATQKATNQTRAGSSGKNIDRYGTKVKELLWRNSSGQELPIGVAIYSPKKDSLGKEPWLAKTWQIDFHTQSIRTVDSYTGEVKNTLVTYATTPSRKEYRDVKYKLHVTEAQYQEIINKKYVWSLWNPTLSIDFGFGSNVSYYGTKFNFINYGYKKQLPLYQFMSPVLMYDNVNKTSQFGVELGSYNIGEDLPIVKNLHVGVGIMSNKSLFLGVSSVL